MSKPRYLSSNEAARRLGIEPSTWRAYHSRKTTPEPDVWIGATPGWSESTIDGWERPGQGARTDRAPVPTTCRAATRHGYGRTCKSDEWKDGFCRTHHPGSAVAADFGLSAHEKCRLEYVERVKTAIRADEVTGLTMAQARCLIPAEVASKAARDDFESVVRRDDEIVVSREPRINAAGRVQQQVVLRLRPVTDA